jgi:hypothetical protein
MPLVRLLDDLIRPPEQRLRYREVEVLGGFEIQE